LNVESYYSDTRIADFLSPKRAMAPAVNIATSRARKRDASRRRGVRDEEDEVAATM